MNITERDKYYPRKFRQEKPLAVKAHQKVANAVHAGRIPRADSQKCVDCGGRAYCYDHRDYTKPLEVEPVCGGCNKKRGPAHPYIASPAGSTPSAQGAGSRSQSGKSAADGGVDNAALGIHGLAHRAVETGLSPYFALAQLHAERVGKSTGQSRRQHQHKTLEYLLMGLRDG